MGASTGDPELGEARLESRIEPEPSSEPEPVALTVTVGGTEGPARQSFTFLHLEELARPATGTVSTTSTGSGSGSGMNVSPGRSETATGAARGGNPAPVARVILTGATCRRRHGGDDADQ